MSVDDDLADTVAEGLRIGWPRIFVTVGTDHHPFDRVVRWADAWAAEHPQAEVVVQHGEAAAPQVASGHLTLPFAQMRRYMEAADVVITQGGPGGIMDSRAVGRLPIVVPRTVALGEHVDDHQVEFSRHMAAQGRIALALDEAEFRALISRAIEHPEEFVVALEKSPTAATAATIEAAINRLVAEPRRRRWTRRR